MKSKQWQKAEGFERKHSGLPIPGAKYQDDLERRK